MGLVQKENMEGRVTAILQGLAEIHRLTVGGLLMAAAFRDPVVLNHMGSVSTCRRHWLRVRGTPQSEWRSVVKTTLQAHGRKMPRPRMHLGPVAEAVLATINIHDHSIFIHEIDLAMRRAALAAGEPIPMTTWVYKEIRRRRGYG